MKQGLRKFCLLLVTIVGAVVGCAGKVEVGDKIDLPKLLAQRANKEVTAVSISEVKDMRPMTEIGTVQGRPIQASSDISSTISQGISNYLASVGIGTSDAAPLVVAAELRRWDVAVDKGGRNDTEAKAELAIKVLDPVDKVIYSGSYQGSAFLQGAKVTSLELTELLQLSMEEALKQLVSDKQLVRLLASY